MLSSLRFSLLRQPTKLVRPARFAAVAFSRGYASKRADFVPFDFEFSSLIPLIPLPARKYTPDHEWVSVSNGVGTIGITDYAQKALGDVVFADLPEKGKSVDQKDNIGAVESVKAASDIYAPISGEIVEVNSALADEPSLLNSSPYEKAWIAKIKLSKPEEFDALLDESGYNKLIEE
ncbi:hypothetical protein HK101_007281 [Irineochytrium annulatum]|nr:hypothetical protein HK101_007281 [Irineochytrium annulatum]